MKSVEKSGLVCYKFGFNGQLTDDEWMGGQSVSFEFRTEDPRLGRFLSVDPLAGMTPWETPYAFANNSPIAKFDYLGLMGATVDPKSPPSQTPAPKGPAPKQGPDAMDAPNVDKDGGGGGESIFSEAPQSAVDAAANVVDRVIEQKTTNNDLPNYPSAAQDNSVNYGQEFNSSNNQNEEDCCPQWLVNGAKTLQGAMTIDAATPDASDLSAPKWIVEGALWTVTGAILYFNEPPDLSIPDDITRPYAIPRDGNPKDYLYRALSEDDYWEVLAFSPLLPKSIGGTIADHVAGRPTQYISASETLLGAIFYDSGYGVIIIDKAKLIASGSTIVPHNNVLQAVKNAPDANRSQLINDAVRAQEVLIKGGISPSAILGFVPGTGLFGK